MIELPAERDVLAPHVIESSRRIPRPVRISWILREVRRTRGCCRAINRRQQDQVASRIVNFSPSERQPVQVFVKPKTVVEHEPQETLLWCVTTPKATHAAPGFASGIAGQREGHLVEELFGSVVILHLNAVVGV